MLPPNALFLAFFALYTTATVLLVLLGLASGLAGPGLPLHGAVDALAGNQGALQQAFTGAQQASHAHISGDPLQLTFDYLLSALNLGFGVFLVWRRPDNWVARLLGLGMVGAATAFNFQSHVVLLTTFTALAFITQVHFVIHAFSGVTYVHALLLFPNGKLVPHWAKWPLIGMYAYAGVEIVMSSVGGQVLSLLKGVIDVPEMLAGWNAYGGYPLTPYLFAQAAGKWDWATTYVFGAGFTLEDVKFNMDLANTGVALTLDPELWFLVLMYGVLIPIVGVSAQVYRYRTVATAQERQQTKFLLLALGVAALVAVAFVVLALGGPLQGMAPQTGLSGRLDVALRLFPPLFAIIPVSLFIAIVRHRLFDIDLLINRTLVYGTLTALLGGLFVALSLLGQRLLVAATGQESGLAPVLAALVVTAAFQPLRARVQDQVDRRFYRRKYDAARTLEAFSARLREQVDLDSLASELRAAVGETMQPTHVSVWLKK
ncbi:MAG: putative signal transduction histidine kinase [Chloroflexi bacterium]|nr:putative signal transduction histidine kinase [Chloroflexota bacterium]